MTDKKDHRSRAIILRVAIGALVGSFLGLLELWFYKFDLPHLLAAMLAGATFMMIIAVFVEQLQGRNVISFVIGSLSGSAASLVWWLIAKPNTSLSLALFTGLCFGMLFIWSELGRRSNNSVNGVGQ
jgi:heme O synthase-like polyprenyltransferase